MKSFLQFAQSAVTKSLDFFLFSFLLFAMVYSLFTQAGCAAATTSCKVIELGAEACEVLVPVAGPDGKVTYVHVPASDIRAHASAVLLRSASAAPSASAPPAFSFSPPAPSASH